MGITMLKPFELLLHFLSRVWEFFSFSWVNSLLLRGTKGDLNVDSARGLIPETDSAFTVTRQFEESYEKCKAEVPEHKQPNVNLVWKAMFRIYKWEMLLHLVLGVFESGIRLLGPVLLRRFLIWLEGYSKGDGVDDHPVWEGWMLGLLLSSTGYLFMLTHHRFFWIGMRVGFNTRQMAISAVHAKALRLNSSTLSWVTTGQVVNLVSNDVQRFDDAFPFWLFLILGPFELICVYIMVSLELGWLASFAGISTMMLLVPTQSLLSRFIAKYRDATAQMTDRRVHLLSQLISGSLAVKMLGWEDPFIQNVHKLRNQEKTYLTRMALIRGGNMALNQFIASIVAFITFVVVRQEGASFDVPKVFYALSLLNLPKLSMALFFVFAVQKTSEMMVSIRRIDRFLKLPEQAPCTHTASGAGLERGTIKLDNVGFKWHVDDVEMTEMGGGGRRGRRKFSLRPRQMEIELRSKKRMAAPKLSRMRTLDNLCLDIRPGQLVGIAGAVGSGKSSLISALLGDMREIEGIARQGRSYMCGSVAYVSQVPWIMAGTIRENILFGKSFDKEKYERALEACALEPDLKQLEAGDATEIGERGINLSGGQKARISLARAAYSSSDIQLLDDPLSAVDPAVGRTLFDKCIGPEGAMHGRTRLLVTHQVHFLPKCDIVLILRDGAIVARGKWEALKQEGYSELVGKHTGKGRASLEVSLDAAKHHDVHTSDDNSMEEITEGDETATSEEMGSTSSNEKITSFPIKENMSDDSIDKLGEHGLKGKEDEKDGKLVKEEGKETGVVAWKVYWEFLCHVGLLVMLIVTIMLFLSQSSFIVSEWWLAQWADADPDEQDESKWLMVLGLLTLSVTVFSISYTLICFAVLVRGSTRLHNVMLEKVIRSPLKFFHTNPTGRILNRFSKDQGMVDELLPDVLVDVAHILVMTVGTLVLVGVAVPIVIPMFVVVLWVLFRLRKKYVTTSREVKRFEGLTRSPMYASISENLKGLPTIRAYNAQDRFESTLLSHMDLNGSWWYAFLGTSRWVGFRMDFLSATILASAVILSLAMKDTLSIALIALALSHGLQLSGSLQWCIRQTAELENSMTSVERMMEYTKLEQEPPRVAEGGGAKPPKWPKSGEICYKNLTASYRPGLNPVLTNLTFKIPGGSSVGIVGRTGSGKSSLMLTLYRLIDVVGGQILIDGVDTCKIGIDALRDQLAIIPQDPVLFSGTLRANLDPWDQRTDAEVWEVLRMVELKPAVEKLGGLSAVMANCGDNLSVGQRQLICLARALLKDATILALDEATANVDRNTDAMIQRTLRECIKPGEAALKRSRTLLVIAHRIDTIMDCDYLIVLDKGQMVEFGPPSELLDREGGIFASMVSAAKNASKTGNSPVE